MKTAFEKDTDWLKENYPELTDYEKFCDWVSRMVADGGELEASRIYAAEWMLEE